MNNVRVSEALTLCAAARQHFLEAFDRVLTLALLCFLTCLAMQMSGFLRKSGRPEIKDVSTGAAWFSKQQMRSCRPRDPS